MGRVILLNHLEQECGVHQFGEQLYAALKPSSRHQFDRLNVSSVEAVERALATKPDAVIVNWHPVTMGRYRPARGFGDGVPAIAILHEVTEGIAEGLQQDDFDYYVVHDPSARIKNPIIFKSGRIVPSFRPSRETVPERFTVGSFGFATPGKGFEALVARVNTECEDCIIRLHLTHSHFFDPRGEIARGVADRCRSIVTKPKISLEITHDFRTSEKIVEFLSENSINAFFYSTADDRGISSAIDLALAAERPIAIRKASMFRHVLDVTPSILVEDRRLESIAADGFEPLRRLSQNWTAEAVRQDYERMLDVVLGSSPPSRLPPSKVQPFLSRLKTRFGFGAQMRT
jgi:hypothetical protein